MIICTFEHPISGSKCCASLDDDGQFTIIDEDTGEALLTQNGVDQATATRLLVDGGLPAGAITWEA